MGKIVYNGREYLSAGTASTMQGATSTTDGVSGLVPQPLIADRDKVLKGDGTWGDASEVEANPSETATDTLQTVDINGTIYDVNKSYLIQNAEIYSEDEKQVGVWIDGRPLYRKTVKSTTIPSSSAWTSISLDLPSDAVIKMYSAYYRRTNNRTDLIPQYNPSDSNDWLFGAVSSNDFVYKVSSPYTSDFVQTDVIVTYIKSNDATGSGGYQAYGFSPIIYSTEEREVGVGENEKPLYQKTIESGSLPPDSLTTTGLTNIDTCHVLAIKVINIDNNSEYSPNSISMYNYEGAGTYYGSIYLTNNELQYINASRVNAIKIRAVIQYTKTTDVAGSGSYNTLGVPMVHYSTDEQVIGTWIDGKPIYQKTIDTILSSNVTYIDTSMLNIKKLIEIIGQCDSNNGNNALFVPYYEDSTWRMIPGMDYANQQLSIVTTATVLQYYSKLSMTIKYTKTTD